MLNTYLLQLVLQYETLRLPLSFQHSQQKGEERSKVKIVCETIFSSTLRAQLSYKFSF